MAEGPTSCGSPSTYTPLIGGAESQRWTWLVFCSARKSQHWRVSVPSTVQYSLVSVPTFVPSDWLREFAGLRGKTIWPGAALESSIFSTAKGVSSLDSYGAGCVVHVSSDPGERSQMIVNTASDLFEIGTQDRWESSWTPQIPHTVSGVNDSVTNSQWRSQLLHQGSQMLRHQKYEFSLVHT